MHVYLDDALLADLHDRGIVNEDALVQVLTELRAGEALTFDHVARIFGIGPAVSVCTIPDDTARQLVREMVEWHTNDETHVDEREWVKTARRMIAPEPAGDRAAVIRESRGDDDI